MKRPGSGESSPRDEVTIATKFGFRIEGGKINGTDVLKYIRNTPSMKGQPVIVLSDGTMADVATLALTLGVQGTLLKSQCSPEELIKMIRKVLGEDAPSALTPPAP